MRHFEKINKCPLCGSIKKLNTYSSYPNLYSELISKDLKINEVKILKKIKNVKCKVCGLIYKNVWFNDKYLAKIFSSIIPNHPKGWDTVSNLFSKKYFVRKMFELKKFYKFDLEKFNKSKREIFSFVNSIQSSKKSNKLKLKFLKNIKSENLEFLNKNKSKIIKIISKPKMFTRYSGFRSESLFNHIENKVGTIKTYSEIGCPLWGMLQLASKKGCKTRFYKPEPHCFWGKNCKKNNKKCIKEINLNTKIFKNPNVNTDDFFGCFLYLDHLKKPLQFLRKKFLKSKSIGLILEKSSLTANHNKGVPIQHFTGWNKKSISYISKRLNKKTDFSFKEIKKEGYQFFLIY